MGASHTLTPYTLSIARGDGLVARFGDVVMYIAGLSASADRLLSVIDSVAETENAGAVIAQPLAAIAFATDSASGPPFGVVAPTADGLLVLLRGNVIAAIDAADGARTLSGERAFTWVDEILPVPVRRIAVTSGDGAGVSGHRHTDLRAGVVPGGGFVLCRAGAVDEKPAGAKPVPTETMWSQEPTRATLAPVETAAGYRAPAQTADRVPVADVLTSEDGAVYPLDRNYVIGRDPLRDESVRNALASPIAVANDQHVSRVHAYVSIDASRLFVRDASTPGGTFIAAPGAENWTQIGTAPTELKPGWSLRIGEWILTYRTHG